jgi:heterodisulfide reductase subunit C
VGEQDPNFDPRRLIRRIILGLRDEVLGSRLPWRCSTCFTCQETCPQKVGFTEVLFVVKNLAAEEGRFPPGLSAQPELLREHGRLYEITEFENEKRTELGLPPLDERPQDFQALLKDLKLGAKKED